MIQQLTLPNGLVKVVRKNIDGKRMYVIDGEESYFPSVTTVLGCRGKSYIHQWRNRVGEKEANAVSLKASTTGTAFHSLCEAYLENELSGDHSTFAKTLLKANPNASGRFKSFIPAMKDITGIYFQEEKVVSKVLETVGTIDVFGTYKHKNAIIDFKTSRRVKKLEDITSYFAQCYAYAQSVKEMYGIICETAVILMSYETGYEIFEMPITHGKEYFLESLRMYNNGESD